MDVKTRIETAKANLRRAEQAKTVAETQKAEAEKQRAEIEAKMLEEGVTPDTIAAEISRLEAEIEQTLTTVESLIPQV
jgi:chromosome segregation ATPase